MKICNVNEMRTMDANAIKKFGIIDEILMENAGLAAYSVISGHSIVKKHTYAIFCGGGNNGGDGFVVARKIISGGGKPVILVLTNPEKYKGAAKTNFDIIKKLPVDLYIKPSSDQAREVIDKSNVIIDAIFGTGLSRNVEGSYKKIIEIINQGKKPVFSLDIPSGINGDNGEIMGIAIKADHTITFGLPKLGNILYPGYDVGGKLWVTHISFPPSLYESDDILISINQPSALPPRNPDGHKGSFGNVLFVAGASSYLGAPYFAAMSFLKSGGGYSRLAAPKSITPFIASKGSEIVFIPMEETESGSISLKNTANILAIAENSDMVVVGPGLSLDKETGELIKKLVSKIDIPLLLDGDGITAISDDPDILKNRKAPTILTPHFGEMARIAKKSVNEIKSDRIGILRTLCRSLNAVIVLKGAHSLIGYPDGHIFINMTGNSAMGTAGSGDVLAGTIAAMYGLCQDISKAVATGVFIHGLSGDLAARKKGEDGVTASDIMEFLPFAMKIIRKKLPDKLKACYEIPVVG